MSLSNFQARITRTIYSTLRKKFIELGYTVDVENYATTTEEEAAKAQVVASKGFYVEVFNEGGPQAKGLKKVPRINIKTERILPGEIGTGVQSSYTGEGPFNRQIYKNVLSDIYVSITYTSNTIFQDRLLAQVIHSKIGARSYLPYLYSATNVETELSNPDPNDAFLMEQMNYYDIGESPEGLIERIYEYKIADVITEEPDITEVPAINQITITKVINETPSLEDTQVETP